MASKGARVTRIPIYDDSVPIACTASPGQLPEHLETLVDLRSELVAVDRTPDGVLLHFARTGSTLAEVRRFAVAEKGCCQFWGLEVHEDRDRVTLRWDGPPAVTAFFEGLIDFLRGDQPLTAFPDLR